MRYIMKCGHAVETLRKPRCAICDETEVISQVIDINGRKAKCIDCNNIVDSKVTLPFFRYQPDKEMDTYYCGCRGWE